MLASSKVWARRYTGRGSPVDPDVKNTKPGQLMKSTSGPDGRSSGDARRVTRSPARSASGTSCASDDGSTRRVPAGIGGSVRQLRVSGGSRITGAGPADSAKKSATASGRFAITIAVGAVPATGRSASAAHQLRARSATSPPDHRAPAEHDRRRHDAGRPAGRCRHAHVPSITQKDRAAGAMRVSAKPDA